MIKRRPRQLRGWIREVRPDLKLLLILVELNHHEPGLERRDLVIPLRDRIVWNGCRGIAWERDGWVGQGIPDLPGLWRDTPQELANFNALIGSEVGGRIDATVCVGACVPPVEQRFVWGFLATKHLS